MTAIQLLSALSADPWVDAAVWQYDLEQTVGVVAVAYAAALIQEGGCPPNADEAQARLRQRGAGGHSAEWWAVQLIREIGWLLCEQHPEGVQANTAGWLELQSRMARLARQIDGWEAHHMAVRPAVEAGTHLFGWADAAGHPGWVAAQRRRYALEAEWVDGGGVARFRAVAMQWALRADCGLPYCGTSAPDWMRSPAFRREAGTEILAWRWEAPTRQQDAEEWEAHRATLPVVYEAVEAAWEQWKAAVNAAFPEIPYHAERAMRGGVGPH